MSNYFTHLPQAAELLTTVLGRKITHTPVTFEEQISRWTSYGISEDYARLLATFEQGVDAGSEEKLHENPNARVGTVRLKDWFERNKHIFQITAA